MIGDILALILVLVGNFSPLSMMLAVGVLQILFIKFECLSISNLLRVFIIKKLWILLNAFSESIDMTTWFFFFSLLMQCVPCVRSCPTLVTLGMCLPGFSVHGVFQTRLLEWLSFPPPGDLPDPRIKSLSSLPPTKVDSLSTESSGNSVSSVQFSHSIMSDSLWPLGLQHGRPPCPSSTPGAYSNSCPLSWWCHIQPSHLLLSPSSPTFNLSQHQGLFLWVSSSHQVAKILEFQLQDQSFQWTPRIDLL